jgi:hypothetical protein
MAAQQQRSGKPWSGANPIPNIQKFIENLDKEKTERDRKIDENSKPHADPVVAHKNTSSKGVNRKWVTDPTTGKEVEIEDVGKDFMKAVEDPQV